MMCAASHPESCQCDDVGMPDDLTITLRGKRAELERELAQLEKPEVGNGGISFGKRVGEGTSVAVERLSQVGVHDRLREILATVIRAQAKLSEGTYGTCDGCGAPIATDRLTALPWAANCVKCASKR